MSLRREFGTGVAALIGTASLVATPVLGAEALTFTYGPFSRNLSVKSLQIFADTGKVSNDLRPFLKKTSAEKQERLRSILNKKLAISPMLLSRFLYSHIGEDVITLLGKSIKLPSGANGRLAIRSAMVGAALDGDGLSLLNVMENLPTDVNFDGEHILGVKKDVDVVLLATNTVVDLLRKLSDQEAKLAPAVDYSQQEDLARSGPYEVIEKTWNLTDQSRNRDFYVKIYRPREIQPTKTSVIIFSHGLLSSPEAYADGLRNLASRGYLVAAPQHPGSDTEWFKGMAKGFHTDVFDVNEFINRPKDISFVIDELERRNQGTLDSNLKLNRVGIAGHSYGGYTALAIGGATIDFDYLEKRCNLPFGQVDISQLLECQALRLPRTKHNFRDERIQAIYAYNPVNRDIFGPKGIGEIAIPTLLASGSYDFAAPPALEQTSSFTWLRAPDKYWMLLEGQAHVNFDEIDPGIKKSLEAVTNLALPSEGLIGAYIKSTSVAFFKVHVDNDEGYRKYLQSTYAQYLSKDETFDLFMITNQSDPAVVDAVRTFRKKYNRPE